MRKVLLTVMMVSSLLAFNACKKDGAVGPQGPAGPAGATGAAGPAGAVGATGAKGADGTKILPTTGAPAATLGAAGDYAFDSATKMLYGPKTTTWPAGVALSGANGATGATGATGANGTQFLAGAGAPTNAIGATGDYYFDTTTSTFYGPKLADGTWGTNVMPLGSSFSAKTYTITRAFENVVEVAGTKVFGQDLVPTYTSATLVSSYNVDNDDLLRIANYPARPDGTGGWSENREMIFETNIGSNTFTSVPSSAANLGAGGLANMQVGAKFRYSNNTVNPLVTFTLTQNDIDRLKVNGGSAFAYLTYGKVSTPAPYTLGTQLTFYTNKNLQVKTSTTNYYTTYTASTKLDIPTLVGPSFEKYKQDGKVFVKYRYYTAKTATGGNTPVVHATANAGWIDLTTWANNFVIAGAGAYDNNANVNPFNAGAANFMSSGAVLGNPGTAVIVGPNQTATAQPIVAGDYANGKITINWAITSGVNPGAVPTYVGPNQLQNNGNVNDPVSAAYLTPSAAAQFVARNFATDFYSSTVIPNPTLTATNNAGTAIAIGAGDMLNVNGNRGGQPATYFTGTNLVQVQVFAIPGDVIKALKAKGVDTNNPTAIGANIKL